MISSITTSNVRAYLAVAIIAGAGAVTAFLIVFSTLRGDTPSALAISLGTYLLGYASHELGVNAGTRSTLAGAESAATPAPTPPTSLAP